VVGVPQPSLAPTLAFLKGFQLDTEVLGYVA
jgi:hypothetical protein